MVGFPWLTWWLKIPEPGPTAGLSLWFHVPRAIGANGAQPC